MGLIIFNLIVAAVNFWFGWQKEEDNRYAKYNLIVGGWALGLVTFLIMTEIYL